jgi:hypothetical protein
VHAERNDYLLFVAVGLSASAAPVTRHPQLRRVKVHRPNIVIHGAYLAKVEVWGVPTGTEITADEYVLLGNAKRRTAPGSKEVWLFPIPPCATDTRLSDTEIFVKGLDTKGTVIATKSLPYSGASDVYKALCGVQ